MTDSSVSALEPRLKLQSNCPTLLIQHTVLLVSALLNKNEEDVGRKE